MSPVRSTAALMIEIDDQAPGRWGRSPLVWAGGAWVVGTIVGREGMLTTGGWFAAAIVAMLLAWAGIAVSVGGRWLGRVLSAGGRRLALAVAIVAAGVAATRQTGPEGPIDATLDRDRSATLGPDVLEETEFATGP